jgi:diguanylate cyclase (GGDEF)-like protein
MGMPKYTRSFSPIILPLILSVLLVLAILSVVYWVYLQTQVQLNDSVEIIHQTYRWAMFLIAMLSISTLAIILVWVKKIISSQEEKLAEQMNYDSLTGLANRSLFWDRLHLTIAQAKRHEQLIALININIDRFNQINTGLGHDIADLVLKEISNRLRAYMRASDTIARISADNFIVLSGDSDNKNKIENIVKRVSKLLTETYYVNEHELNINVSIGIAVFPADQQSAEKLLLASQTAMLQAKRNKTGEYVFFSEDMACGNESSLQEEQDLKHALLNNEFILYYQPKVDSTQGSINGLEALLRWQHPERGLVPPNEFIPALEKNGLIIPVGDWVITEACSAIQRWQASGLPAVPVSVNVSAPQFNQDGFVQRIKSILDETAVAPELLEIELTESCLMDNADKSADVLWELKNLGLSIAVDDFGTGYSSLNHLNQFPIDTLKIDRSFITNVNNRKENDNAGIVTAIMALSHSLRLNVVAEGVETAQELAFLYALGCRTIQGFLFSRPLSESDVIDLFQNSQSMNEILQAVRTELNTASG